MIDRMVRHMRWRASVARPTAVSFAIPSSVVALVLLGAAPVCVAQSSQNAATAKVQSDRCAADNGGITLSPGFCATVFADNLGHTRQMAFGPDGILYVAARGSGNVVAIPRSNQTTTVLTGLTGPHSLAFASTYLYVSTDNAVWRFPIRDNQIVKEFIRSIG